MAEAIVSIKRLQAFMRYEEVSTRVKKDNHNDNKESNDVDEKGEKIPEGSIYINNASAKWLAYESEDTLKNINIKIEPGKLIAIVGQVGSGKSSLLNTILKELNLNSGSIQVHQPSLKDRFDNVFLTKMN